MIRPGAIVMTVLMSAVAVGVYFGLDYLPQDMVPGKGVQKVPAAEAPRLEGAGTALATSQVDRLASGTEDPIAPAASGNQSAVVTEEDLAEEPAAFESAPAPAMASSSPSAESTVDFDPAPGGTGIPVEENATAAAPEPEPAAAVAVAEPVTPAPRAAAPTKKTVETPARQPAAKPASIASTAPASEPKRQPAKAKNPQADVIKPWWPDPATIPVNQLKLQYAGQVQNEQAVALLFSAPLNLDTLRQHASVLDSVGNPVQAGQWELAKNTRMAVLRGISPGRYTVILTPAIADSKGMLLGMTLQGPVYIQAQ